MRELPGLELLRQLAIEHWIDGGAASTLVPCVHESLEGDLELLAAGVRRLGGSFVNLTADDEWVAPPGPISIQRRALVEGILRSAVNTVPPITLSVIDSRVTASTAPGVPPEPSLIPILRAAATIASSLFDSIDLAVLAADMSTLDPGRRELLWTMLTIEPTDLRSGPAPLLVAPILGKRLEPEVDYRRRPSVQYVVRWDRVLQRSAIAQERAIAEIAENADRPLVLFLGAGASASARIPLGNAYRDIALRELVGKHEDSDTAAGAFFDLLRARRHLRRDEEGSRSKFIADLTLERVLQERFQQLGVRPRTDSPFIRDMIRDCATALEFVRPARRAIRELARLLKGRLILITVNFDQLVEDELGSDHRVYATSADFGSAATDIAGYLDGDSTAPIPILKLHGTITEPDSLIASIDRTSAGLQDDVIAALSVLVDEARIPVPWVWVGCSMRDRDVNSWLGGLNSKALDEWWVDPLPGQSLDAFVAQQRSPRWSDTKQSLSDRLIIDGADGFLSDLVDAVRRHAQ